MEVFDLGHLDDTQFEEFCYDLLVELGFVNVRWRKGTSRSTSPADRGRDIECELEHTDIDGRKRLEKWFVECKHYDRGVPPEKIHNAFTWASAKKPHVLLIIASGFFSNGAIDYIDEYEKNNQPYYRVKYWQKPDLDHLVSGKTRLLEKYRLKDFRSIIHAAHFAALRPPMF